MNFQKTILSRGFWIISGASVLIAVAVWAIAHTVGIPWALGLSVGALGLLLGGVYAQLRMALSSATSGLAGLRKLAFEHRNQAHDLGSEIRSNAEEASRSREDVARSLDLATQRFRTLDQTAQKVGDQLQDALKQLNKMDEGIERLVASTDRANSKSLAADVHRTLRGTRALEITMAETAGLEERVSHTFKHEIGNLERLREEMAVQRRILNELLLAADFKA